PERRLRLVRGLVRTRPEAEALAPRLAVGDAGDDGARRAVRDRGQVHAPESPGGRARRRRRDADERDGGADHRGQVLRALGRPGGAAAAAAHHARAGEELPLRTQGRRPARAAPDHGVVQAEGARVPPRPLMVVEELDVSSYTIPTDAPESDGTLEWDSTTIVV